jgi:hypothetical protein
MTADRTDQKHYQESSFRESIIEHSFLGELLRYLWETAEMPIEVLKPIVDHAGYDIVIECSGIVRHIQLKAKKSSGKSRQVGVHERLAAKPSGCVLIVLCDPNSLNVVDFKWFGGKPGEPLPPITNFAQATDPKTKNPRLRSRTLKLDRCESLGPDIAQVANRLFHKTSL